MSDTRKEPERSKSAKSRSKPRAKTLPVARVWDPETESVTHELVGHEGRVAALVRSSSGELAVTAGHDGTLRLWSLSMVRQSSAIRPLPVGE